MKKIACLIMLISLTGCCTYQKNANIESGMEKSKVEKQYKSCLASEFITTIKFWIGMQKNK